jgi:hypothetical protein
VYCIQNYSRKKKRRGNSRAWRTKPEWLWMKDPSNSEERIKSPNTMESRMDIHSLISPMDFFVLKIHCLSFEEDRNCHLEWYPSLPLLCTFPVSAFGALFNFCVTWSDLLRFYSKKTFLTFDHMDRQEKSRKSVRRQHQRRWCYQRRAVGRDSGSLEVRLKEMEQHETKELTVEVTILE